LLLRNLSKRANFMRNMKMSPDERSRSASHAALARWSKPRKVQKLVKKRRR
jgi:hypothetical protein